MIKLVLSDLDGTLIDNEGTMDKKDRDAIASLGDYHLEFGFVTGRDIGFCHHFLERYQLGECDIIANNGGSLWMHGEKIWEEHMEADEVLHIMRQLCPFLEDMNPFICNESQEFFLLKEQYATKRKWEEVKQGLAYLGNISDEDLIYHVEETREAAVKISIHLYTQERTTYWLPIFKEMFPNYEVLPTSFDYIELTKKGIDKGTTLCQMMEYLDIQPHEVAVFGDGLNDISMFSCVEHSFAMAQAPIEVRESASKITKSVAEAITSVIQYNVLEEMKQ